MDDEKHCSSFNIWMEYTKHGWVTAGLFRVRQMELGGKTKGVVNGTFQSKWKERVNSAVNSNYDHMSHLTAMDSQINAADSPVVTSII